jgi:hypothetical protein
VRESEGKIPRARPSCRWKDNVGKMDLQEIGWKVVHWIDLAQDTDRRQTCC